MKRVARLAVTPRFPTGCGQTAFDAVLNKIKEITDGEEEDLVAEFYESLCIRKTENPRDFAERLEHIAESLAEFHGVVKTDGELIDQMICTAEDNKILCDTAKHIKRERKCGRPMNLELVKTLLEQDLRHDKRKRKGKRRKGKGTRGSSSSESSSDDDREGDRLEEQALQARQPEPVAQRRLGPGWMPQCQQQPFCLNTWNSIGSPMQEQQQQLGQWQCAGAALD